MLDELTIEANEESFVIVLQHGGNDVTCKRSIMAITFTVDITVLSHVVLPAFAIKPINEAARVDAPTTVEAWVRGTRQANAALSKYKIFICLPAWRRPPLKRFFLHDVKQKQIDVVILLLPNTPVRCLLRF